MKKAHRPEIPRKTIYRLSVYLRCLQRLKANDIRTVSSEALSKVAGVKPTQLRKDLTYFGQFGTRDEGLDHGQGLAHQQRLLVPVALHEALGGEAGQQWRRRGDVDRVHGE